MLRSHLLGLSYSGGGYIPPPDYTSLRALFIGMAFDAFLASLSGDMKPRFRYILRGMAVTSVLAAIFTVPLVQLSPALEAWLRTLAGNPVVWFLLVFTLFETIYLSPIYARYRRARIDVVAPLANNAVQLKTVVFGMVHPPHHPIRVMIFSADRLYHRQDAPTVFSNDGTRWSVECQVGLPTSPTNQEYEIVAIDGGIEIDAVCAILPADIVKSLPVKVRRA